MYTFSQNQKQRRKRTHTIFFYLFTKHRCISLRSRIKMATGKMEQPKPGESTAISGVWDQKISSLRQDRWLGTDRKRLTSCWSGGSFLVESTVSWVAVVVWW
ncbi:hypothetical protein RYX36_007912 [Vicia faba]